MFGIQTKLLMLGAATSILTACGDNSKSCGEGTTAVAGVCVAMPTCGNGTMLVDGECVATSGPTCGSGTTLVNGECVASPGPTCGSGTTLVNGMCVADPAACGPGTMPGAGGCVLDPSAPAPVTGLTASEVATNIHLNWAAGAGSVGTLVARLDSGAQSAPVRGQVYTVGSTLPGGGKVVAVGAATAADDAFTLPGRYSYMVWSINASGNFGFGREVAIKVPLPAQTGEIALDLSGPTATVNMQPGHVAISLSNAIYDSNFQGFGYVDVTITNNTAGPLVSPKLIVKSLSVGQLMDVVGTTTAGDEYLDLGLGMMLPGETRTRTLGVANVAATDTITAALEIEESGLIAGVGAVTGESSRVSSGFDVPGAHGPMDSRTYFNDGLFSPSGRYYYAVSRRSSALYRIDASTGDATAITPAAQGQLANGVCIGIAGDGFAYLGIMTGAHRGGDGGGDNVSTIEVARVDLGSMTPIASTTLVPTSGAVMRACTVAGSRMAIAHGANAYFFNTTTMAFIDADTDTTVIDPVNTGDNSPLRSLVFDDAGALYAVGYAFGSKNIYKIDSALDVTTFHTATSSGVYSLTVGPTGALWWGSDNGLYSFDGVTQMAVPSYNNGRIKAIVEIGETSAKVFAASGSSSETVDLQTGAITNAMQLGSQFGHRGAWLK